MSQSRRRPKKRLTYSSANIAVKVERLPQVIDTFWTGLRTDIEKDNNVRLQQRTEGIEKPAMRVELFRICRSEAQPPEGLHVESRSEPTLLFQAEDNLSRDNTLL